MLHASLSIPLLLTIPHPGSTSGDWLVSGCDTPARVIASADGRELSLDNGLIRRTLRIQPNVATVAFDDLMTGASLLRAVEPEAILTFEGGVVVEVGGLHGQPDRAYLTPEWLEELVADESSMQYAGHRIGEPAERFAWKPTRHHEDRAWPPAGVALEIDFRYPAEKAQALAREASTAGDSERAAALQDLASLTVTVHYELYQGIPVLSKWFTVKNGGHRVHTLEAFTSERLSIVERESRVESREGVYYAPPDLHVEADFAFGGFGPENANRHCVRWMEDESYKTQVSYLRTTPCLLEVGPAVGPDIDIAPGESFESFRCFELVQDSSDRERQGLARRRMYRTIAPWITENPLMMHVRNSDDESVRLAIDQCAEVGFEMVILTFGSGFNIEDDSLENLDRWRLLADYAHSRGVQIGGYSLLSSRRVKPDTDNCVNPETGNPGGQTHGYCPALASDWGQTYFEKLRRFYAYTGFDLLEHDGSYPGDLDASARPPLQKGLADSRWVQWGIITDFYKWCREAGIYLNVPDYYFLMGSSKCGMGYRETNWSLPRAQQIIHARQNMYDGLWTRTPSMGWMFVPLTEYHGGGAAATIEPLEQNLDHYESILESCLGLGVQACYRGPRLFDSERTKAAVHGRVEWFKRYRAILESDVVHGRRADGRALDWMLHVGPTLEHKGMLVVFNPLDEAVEQELEIDLYYTGLEDVARVSSGGAFLFELPLDRRFRIRLPVRVEAGGMSWYLIE